MQRLRNEREAKIQAKNQNNNRDEYKIENGILYQKLVYWREDLLTNSKNTWVVLFHPDMPVKVSKPREWGNWRNGIVNKVAFVDGNPKIFVVCGKKAIVFEKRVQEVRANNLGAKIVEWTNMGVFNEMPKRFATMSTENILREYRKCRRSLTDLERACYKAELSLREHVGETNKKVILKEKRGKRNR